MSFELRALSYERLAAHGSQFATKNKKMNTSIISKKSDLLGIMASGLCAVHCAITPLFFAAKPLLDNAIGKTAHGCEHAPWGWAMLDYVFLAVSLLAVWYSARHTDSRPVRLALWSAWACFAMGLMLEAEHFAFGKWLMYAGSTALVVTHIVNFRHCRACREGNCE